MWPQKWILFWVFIGAFLIITGLTIWGVFFGLAELSDAYKDKLFYALILEILGAVIVLFKTGFAQKAEGAFTKKIWIIIKRIVIDNRVFCTIARFLELLN